MPTYEECEENGEIPAEIDMSWQNKTFTLIVRGAPNSLIAMVMAESTIQSARQMEEDRLGIKANVEVVASRAFRMDLGPDPN